MVALVALAQVVFEGGGDGDRHVQCRVERLLAGIGGAGPGPRGVR